MKLAWEEAPQLLVACFKDISNYVLHQITNKQPKVEMISDYFLEPTNRFGQPSCDSPEYFFSEVRIQYHKLLLEYEFG